MFRVITKVFICMVAVAFIAGCTARTYTVRKERVDQTTEGNAGYLGGTPPPGAKDRGDVKTTRKMYVLEVEKGRSQQEQQEADALMREAEEIAERAKRPTVTTRRSVSTRPAAPIVVEMPAPEPEAGPSMTEYTVQKDDTLQKISMKFFNTTKQWMKIYEANKDKLKSPDRIKPGMVLRIPQE